ncbi:ribose-phosphate pyrophosphokinase [Ferrovibrio sp.]|uniref:ribose-phosphate pyrophosphokinase n=1 Tax=Ferrovibrio sp. TaxID=1917215 RepID=UPI003D11C954
MRLLLPMPGNQALATELARLGAGPCGAVETRHFPDGESYVRLHGELQGREAVLVCTLAAPDPLLLPLVFAADAARDLGAARVTLLAPYLAYMRQDKRFQAGEAVSSKSFAAILSRHVDRLITVDPHLHRYPALDALYTIPAQALHAAPLLADWIAAAVPDALLLGPDAESEQWVAAVAARAGAPHAVLAKTRHGDRSVEIALPDLSAYRGRQPVLVDDIASSGRTLMQAARLLVALGLPKPVCVVVHALFAGDAYAALQPLASRIVSCDSVPHPSNAISLAPLLAAAL